MFKINLVNLPSPLKIKMDYKFPEVLPVKLQKKEIQPRTVSQLVYPDSGFNGLSEVSVNAVTNEIDENIKSENIKKDVSILGVQGSIEGLKGTKIEITKNGTYTPEEPYNAFTEVEANVESDPSEYFTDKISGTNSIYEIGITSTIKKIPNFVISSTTCNRMFYNCSSLQTIPLLDTSKVTTMSSMFQYCSSLQTIPLLDTSKVTVMSSMFDSCKVLTTIPQFNTSNVTSMQRIFMWCTNLTSIPQLDTSKVINMSNMFGRCEKIVSIPLLDAHLVSYHSGIFSYNYELTDLGGFENLGQAYDTSRPSNYDGYIINLQDSTKLTHDSLMNVINNLYDIAAKGVKTQQLVLGSTNISKLSAEELQICTAKGWSVS